MSINRRLNKNIMFSEKGSLEMKTVQYTLTKCKNTCTLSCTVHKCLCSESIRRYIGVINPS